MKKKVTLLAALAMAVTVGGVYATWNYTQGAATSTASAELTVKLAGETVSNASIGTLAVKGVGGVMLDDTNNDHVAEVVYDGTDAYFYVTFTNMAQGVDTSKMKIKYTVTLSGVYNVEGTEEILSYSQTGGVLEYEDLVNEAELADTQNIDTTIATKKISLQLANFIWSEDLVLDTYAKYTAYNTLLSQKAAKITITLEDISDYTQAAQNN